MTSNQFLLNYIKNTLNSVFLTENTYFLGIFEFINDQISLAWGELLNCGESFFVQNFSNQQYFMMTVIREI
jgi:hypothetical protein